MRNFALLAAAVCLFGLSAHAQTGKKPVESKSKDDLAVRTALSAVFDKAIKDFKNRDIRSFMSMFDERYTRRLDGHTQTLDEVEQQLAEQMQSVISVDEAALTIEKLHVTGYTAEVISSMKLKTRAKDGEGRYGPTGAAHSVETVERARETWIRSRGAWKLKTSVTLPGGLLMVDGRLISGKLPVEPALKLEKPIAVKPKR